MSKEITDAEFIARLIEAGWTEDEAAKALAEDLEDAADEDGMQ
jgi:hypothetical protein